MFDKYLLSGMTRQEEIEFQKRISEDKEFAGDFKIYLGAVKGFCKEEQQDNLDFAIAMKVLSPQQLKNVIAVPYKKRKTFHIPRNITIWTLSMAAMLLVMFSLTYKYQRDIDYNTDNLIVEYNAIVTTDRGGGLDYDIASMTEKQLEECLPILENAYRSVDVDDFQAKETLGLNLSMAYLKMHNRQDAAKILYELKKLYPKDTEFSAQCNQILKQINQ